MGPVALPQGLFPVLESLCSPNAGDQERMELLVRLLRLGLVRDSSSNPTVRPLHKSRSKKPSVFESRT